MYRKLSPVRIAPRHGNQRNESQDVSLQNTALASKAAAFQALDTTLDAFSAKISLSQKKV